MADNSSGSSSRRLRFLLVSDIHCHSENQLALAQWLKADSAALGIDFIVASGDLAVMKPKDNDSAEEVAKSVTDTRQVLENLELIRAALLSAQREPASDSDIPIYWIPGNVRAPLLAALFSNAQCSRDSEPLTEHSINFHNAFVPLASGLSMCGFGGSVPAYQDGKEKWEGYPFDDNEAMRRPLEALLPKATHTSADQLLLVTHVGPTSSATTLDQVKVEESPISTGSSVLDEMLRRGDLQQRVVANVHGHTHYASGLARVGNVQVINPGALLYVYLAANYTLLLQQRLTQRSFGQFGILELVLKEGRWQVAEARLASLL